MELLFIAILLTVTGAQESQLKGPENTLRIVGSNVTLKCLTPYGNCRGIEWLKFIAGNPMTIFNEYGIISSFFRDRNSIDNKSGSCDLIIENVQLTDAGRFNCRALISSNTIERTAYLIILKTHPKCTIIAPLNETVEDDRVQLTCEVTYNGTNTVSMLWKDRQDAPAAVVKNNTISRSYSVVASAPDVPSFTCISSFPLAADDNGVLIKGLAANKLPDANCSTSAIKVFYSVRDVILSPSLSNYPPGTIIVCTANGQPSPTFKWQALENAGTWMDIHNQHGSQFTTSDVTSKRYRCVAMNVVRGKSHNATSHEILVHESSFGIGIGIGIGIGLLIAILLATVAFAILVKLRYLEFHPRPANKSLDGDAQNMEYEMNPSSHQRPASDLPIPRTDGEQESAYASLEDDRDANEYASLEQRQ